MDASEEKIYKRQKLDIIRHHDRYSFNREDYQPQYCNIYLSRLKKLQPHALKAASQKWKDLSPATVGKTIISLTVDEIVVISGIFIKDPHPKISNIYQVIGTIQNMDNIGTMYFLEDATDRVCVKFNGPCACDPQQLGLSLQKGESGLHVQELLMSGIVVALRGYLSSQGVFCVQDLCLVGAPEWKHPTPQESFSIGLISGLSIDANYDRRQEYQLLLEYIRGNLTDDAHLDTIPSNIAHVVIAGNSLGNEEEIHESSDDVNKENLDLLDVFLNDLKGCVSVDVMNDSGFNLYPRPPANPLIFRRCISGDSKVNLVGDPIACNHTGVETIGTCVYNLDGFGRKVVWNDEDVFSLSLENQTSVSRIPDAGHKRLQLMELMLKSRHLAPSAPCAPFEEDPLVLEQCPDVFFCAGGTEFASATVQVMNRSVRLVSVPDFSISGVFVVLSLSEDLKCEQVKLSLPSTSLPLASHLPT